tara:strand:- start:2049 stop:2843 length:795 start_codon:yes stop_codon:yes gene_type:complete
MLKNFRLFNNTQQKIKENYKMAREKQNIEFYQNIVNQYENRTKIEIDIWDAIDKLSYFVDVSDPDINLPNSIHLFQSAEAARNAGEPDWMQLVCLIHDLGKIMYLFGNDETGTSIKKQWAIVGDTFILGCKIPDTIVYSEYNKLNTDHIKYNNLGVYNKGCGLDNCMVSWGHDEFMYQTLCNNRHSLPNIALYIIRYHSLYLWHDKNEYSYFENKYDREAKKFVKSFNKYDLYSKKNETLNIDELKKYYSSLIDKYFESRILLW